MTTPERAENLAQLIKRLRDTYQVSQSEIARRIGVAPATISSWTLGKRGTKRGPSRDHLRALAREFPKFTEDEIFAAAGRETPGPLSPDAEARLLELFKGLTKEQQEFTETLVRTLNETNQAS